MLEKPSSPKPAQKQALKQGLFTHLKNVYYLSIKELRSIRADYILLVLVAYTFTIAVYTIATGASTNPKNLTVGVVDEDHSNLSRQFLDVLNRPPLFKRSVLINANEIDPIMNAGKMIFVLEIPPRFQEDLLAGRKVSLQLNVDATAMAPAGNGALYIQNVLMQEILNYLASQEIALPALANVVVRAKFNPQFSSSWFNGVMQVVNNITMLTVILTGAALIREREHGTVEHLLVMPVVPPEIMWSKIIANGLVILIATALSLLFVIEQWLGIPVAGSKILFLFGAMLYTICAATLGILLGTITSTMGQFALLAAPILLVIQMLSGGMTPMEGEPVWMQYLMRIIFPTPHFVDFSQAVLFRGADFSIVWPELAAMTAIGSVYFVFSLKRFRQVIFGG
ncbi:MAG: ABC transporter permease [Rhodomicrobium sp.]